MDRFIKRLSVFIVFASFSYLLLIFLSGILLPDFLKPNLKFKKGSNGHLFTRVNEVKEYKNVDILFLGSSHAYRGFDTEFFKKKGYSTFNLGSSAQTPTQTEVLLNRYLNDLNPKKIVFEIYPGSFENDGVESSIDLITNDKNDIHSLAMVLNMKHIKTLNSYIYAKQREILNLDKNFSEKKENKFDLYVDGGYVRRKPSEFDFYNYDSIPKKWELREEQIEAFHRIINQLKAKNKEVILVYAPITKINYQKFTNHTEFDSIIKSTSLQYLNFNSILNLDDSYFYDYQHLNQKGVHSFNVALIDYIK